MTDEVRLGSLRGTTVWQDEIPISGTIALPPDPNALDGLGRNHSLPTALADLVDNSIDANATDILIRLIRQDGLLRTLYVVDNGDGIQPDLIDDAMTVGKRRDYGPTDLGRFGFGLKAASFSQAASVTVATKAKGKAAVARRWRLIRDRKDFNCELVQSSFAESELARDWQLPWPGHGTVVRWDDVTSFPASKDSDRVEEFISRTVNQIRSHLGLVFHRLLAKNSVKISIDVEDINSNKIGIRTTVKPVDPFGYLRSGQAGYPKQLSSDHLGNTIYFNCHIWPGRSNLPEFKLPGGHPEQHEGIYFYRRDRLLQAGGDWHGAAATDRNLQLARVEIDIDDEISRLFKMNPEKSRVLVGTEFSALVESAVSDDGTTFNSYLRLAEEKFRQSRQRNHKRKSAIPPGKGFAPQLKKSIANELPLMVDETPIDIRWKFLSDYKFFEIDLTDRTLWLNSRYRAETDGVRRSVNDAPLLKVLLYLLVEDIFKGEYMGVRDKDNIELWQELLTTAAQAEQRD